MAMSRALLLALVLVGLIAVGLAFDSRPYENKHTKPFNPPMPTSPPWKHSKCNRGRNVYFGAENMGKRFRNLPAETISNYIGRMIAAGFNSPGKHTTLDPAVEIMYSRILWMVFLVAMLVCASSGFGPNDRSDHFGRAKPNTLPPNRPVYKEVLHPLLI
ncbi:hypothetical protein AAG570_009056 [Ranatra chinensis]|uniref:Uncharacterized protein n=1 Tax=Ranatra chinensis TaxID=642074 RepID=A0ABD0YSM4_9HEMI